MRIGMMVDTYHRMSGVTHHIALNKQHLEKLGHEVFVFTFGNEKPQNKEDASEALQQFPPFSEAFQRFRKSLLQDTEMTHDMQLKKEERVIYSPALPLGKSGFGLSLRYTPETQDLLQTMDVLHLHHPFLTGQLTLHYSKQTKIPLIFTAHTRYDIHTQAYLPFLPKKTGEVLSKAYFPNFAKKMDLVVAPSRGAKRFLEDIGVPEHIIKHIPNGIDLTPFTNINNPISRHEFGFGADDVIFVYAGRIAPEKNLPFLLGAFSNISKDEKRAKLLIVGDGPELKNIKSLSQDLEIERKIYFTDFIPYQEIPRYLAAADIFVTASISEIHPLSVIEAQAAGLPVIGITSPGVEDIVENEQTGLLAKHENLSTFSAHMTRLVREEETRHKMGIRAKTHSQRYAIEHTSILLLKEYERLVAKNE